MINLAFLRSKQMTDAELAARLTAADLRQLTNEMIDIQLDLIRLCTDADVVFEPSDPGAQDEYAINPDEATLAWNLGHLIVHATASSEEAAYLAAELARGVEFAPRRSRSEVHWSRMTTITGCRARLEESRRMRLASLDMWPDEPYLDNNYISPRTGKPVNAVQRYLFGLGHDDDHLAQIEEVVRQALAAR